MKILFALLVHDCANRMEQLKECIESIDNQKEVDGCDYIKVAFIDSYTESDTIDLLEEHSFKIEDGAGTTQYEKIKYIINTNYLNYDKVCFCHSDDIWYKHKTKYQLKVKEPICISSYVDSNGKAYQYPVRSYQGKFLTYCIMTGWMLDKQVKYINSSGLEYDFGIEQNILSSLMTKYKVGVIVNALFSYVLHEDQLTNKIDNAEEQWNEFKISVPNDLKRVYRYFIEIYTGREIIKRWRYKYEKL